MSILVLQTIQFDLTCVASEYGVGEALEIPCDPNTTSLSGDNIITLLAEVEFGITIFLLLFCKKFSTLLLWNHLTDLRFNPQVHKFLS